MPYLNIAPREIEFRKHVCKPPWPLRRPGTTWYCPKCKTIFVLIKLFDDSKIFVPTGRDVVVY